MRKQHSIENRRISMALKIKGLDQLSKSLNQMKNNLESLDGQNSVPLDEVFTSNFMKTYSSFESLDNFLVDGGLVTGKVTQESFDAIPIDRLDLWVQKETSFHTWTEMLSQATQEWLHAQVFEGVKLK